MRIIQKKINSLQIRKLITKKKKRLSEVDKFYKIKKHNKNNLNDHYAKYTEEEIKKIEEEDQKEIEYLADCKNAERKLRLEKYDSLTITEVKLLIKRNYPLFSRDSKSDLSKLNNYYYSLLCANFLGISIITSFSRAALVYFKFMGNKRILRNSILFSYFIVTIINNSLYINEHMKKIFLIYPIKIKHLIFDPRNESLKVPYNENMYEFDKNKNKEKINSFDYL